MYTPCYGCDFHLEEKENLTTLIQVSHFSPSKFTKTFVIKIAFFDTGLKYHYDQEKKERNKSDHIPLHSKF